MKNDLCGVFCTTSTSSARVTLDENIMCSCAQLQELEVSGKLGDVYIFTSGMFKFTALNTLRNFTTLHKDIQCLPSMLNLAKEPILKGKLC